jgi:signal transduction histidine kinase
VAQQYDTVYERPDETVIQFSSVASPIVVDGDIQGSVVNTQDVSELKRLEEQSRQAQKVESIGRLAGGVAHDLNNLLSPIIGYGELLQTDAALDPEGQEFVEQILEAGFRARNLVRQLLAFSRKQTLEYKPVDMNEAVDGFHKLLRRTIRENIEIEVRPTTGIPAIMADIGQIEQVILNLSVNAQDAMPDGGRLVIETAAMELDRQTAGELGGLEPGPHVVLTIKDSGCGMDEEVRRNLFEPFFSTKGEEGTGLGLSTVYGIVRQHRGNILVDSQPEQGSVFTIYLPVSGDLPEDDTPESTAIPDLDGTETILVVEDSAPVGRLTRIILERRGYTVILASSGAEALETLNADGRQVDLLLTDVVMPEMNGKELFTRAREHYPELKVLYMSGYTDDVIASQGILEEGVDLIQKPFTSNLLATRVRLALNR